MSYAVTKSRVLQWLGIIAILCLFGGAYWYFQVFAGVKTNTGTAQPQGTGNLNSGLAGYWALDDGSGTSATDSSTNGNTGTLTNGPTWSTGQVGGSVDFDGTNDYIDLGSTKTYIDTAAPFAVSVWMSPDRFSSGTGNPLFFFKTSALRNWGGFLLDSSSYRDFTFGKDTDSSMKFSLPGGVTTGVWRHIVITYNGSGFNTASNYAAYVDGAAVTVSAGASLLWSANVSYLGRADTEYFDGKLDEIRFYDRALSSDEVSQLYRLTAPTSVDTSLKGYWSFNAQDMSGTTAYDRSGAGKNGTLTNGPTKAIGKVGQAVTFDGSNDYVNVDNTFGFSNTTFTVSSWVKSTSSSTQFIASQMGNTSNIGGWGINTNSNKFGVTIKSSSGANPYAVNSNRSVADGQWHHVVAVITTSTTVSANNTALLYVDGINDQASPTLDGGVVFAATTETMKIGARTTSGAAADFMNGSIDETRIYNRALTASEIQSLYDLGQSDKSNTSVSQPQGTGRLDSGLAAYFPLDNGSGTSATDVSTNGNTGTLTNGPTWGTGQVGGDVVFDGTDDYILIGSSIKVDSSDRGVISAWVKFNNWTNIDAIYNGIFSYGGPGAASAGNLMLEQRYFTSAHYLAVEQGNNGETRDIVRGSTALALSTWYHVAVVSDGASYKLYLNGVPETLTVYSGSNTGDWFSDTSLGETDQSVIGARYGNGAIGAPLNGALDEVRIYNRPMSDDEVAQLYRLTTPTSVDTGLKGYWSFNAQDIPTSTTAADRSGAGNTGTLTNGPTKTIGKIGQALSFDGTDDYTTVADANTLDITGAISMGLWVKTSDTDSCIVSKTVVSTAKCFETAGNKVYEIGILSNAIYFQTSNGTTANVVSGSASGITDNQWHYLVATWDGTTGSNGMKIYLDGNVLHQGTATVATIQSTSSALTFGGNGGSYDYAGLLDEARLYNRALTAAEIKGLYDAGESDKTNSSVSQPQGTGRLDSGLAGYWAMDNGSGTSATDSSTNGNTLTLNNGPTWTTGQIGNAVNFDGSDDSATVGSGSASLVLTTNLSLSAWIYLDTTPSNSVWYEIMLKGSSGDVGYLYRFSVYNNGSGSFLRFTPGGGGNHNDSSTALTSGQWYHVMVTFDRPTIKFYLNGKLDTTASDSVGGGFSSGSGTFRIGGAATAYFDGRIDEARVYDHALSSDEVGQLYRLTAPTGVDTGLKGYWSFNGQDVSGTTAYDRSGAGNTGTLTNGPTKTIGKIGQALSFDGSNDYVDISTVTLAGEFTYSLWYKTSNNAQTGMMLGADSTGGTYAKFGLVSGNYFIRVVGGGSTDNTITPGSTNQWHHVVITRDSSNKIDLYVDGGSANRLFSNVAQSGSTNLTWIAISEDSQIFSGQMDEVRVYNRALTAAEVIALYNQSR